MSHDQFYIEFSSSTSLWKMKFQCKTEHVQELPMSLTFIRVTHKSSPSCTCHEAIFKTIVLQQQPHPRFPSSGLWAYAYLIKQTTSCDKIWKHWTVQRKATTISTILWRKSCNHCDQNVTEKNVDPWHTEGWDPFYLQGLISTPAWICN